MKSSRRRSKLLSTSGDHDRHFLGAVRCWWCTRLLVKYFRVVHTHQHRSFAEPKPVSAGADPGFATANTQPRIIKPSSPPTPLLCRASTVEQLGISLLQLPIRQSSVSKAQDRENIEGQSTAVAAVVIGELRAVAMKSNPPIAGSNYNGYLATRPAILGLAKVLFLGLCQVSHVSAAPVTQFLGITKEKEDLPKDTEDPSLWLYLGVAAILVLLGGAFAGLTIA